MTLAPLQPAAAVPAPSARTGLRSVGVEEELLLVDPCAGRTVPAAASAIGWTAPAAPTAPRAVAVPLDTELQQEQIETATPPRTDLTDLAADVRALRRAADDAARSVGARVAALATFPLRVAPVLTPTPRYRAIRDQMGLTCAEQLTCGCHVHVAVTSDEEGVAVLDRIRPWLPVLTAVATNSPFWQGSDTGYAGYRTQAWSRWPGTGPAEPFGSAAAYHAVVDELMRTGTLLDEGMVYFDARLSRRYPTVEVRVADVCLDADDTVLVAALARGLVDTAAERWRAGEPVPSDPTSVLRMASWRASRSGTAGLLVHPRTHQPAPAAEVVACLLDDVRPALDASGDLALVEAGLERVLRRGTGAQRQRAVAAATGRLEDVVADAVDRTAA
ncbi:glutamate--cysteine ligase [Cellulomonas fimi]|uniref:glutamate--cysteine ligase n=1 Tax=Cellulomonas fimi TaxID=1708 RepID=UPI00234D8E23|nr:glutamate--cysteine ligase [Cellulomonas fimi]MDC7122897.1 glutamate--cysteine ligase [Cellulomonas fimi]